MDLVRDPFALHHVVVCGARLDAGRSEQMGSGHEADAAVRALAADAADADGLCSLREAVQAANADAEVDGCSAGSADSEGAVG